MNNFIYELPDIIYMLLAIALVNRLIVLFKNINKK